jgi:hypothetical protein
VIAFLVALPLAVYTLAGLFLLVDQDDPVRSLLRLTLRLLLVALLLALVPGSDRIWVGAAFLTVVVLHAGFQLLARRAVGGDRWTTERID